MTAVQSKIYLEIVHQIRSIMEGDGLKAGDRLPSERELSARLNVGRSSVREALRALELVGLIETRRGEGTFVKRFYENGLVQLIAAFLLQDEKTKQDLLQVKMLLERNILSLLLSKTKEQLLPLSELLSSNETSLLLFHQAFFKQAVELTDNHLLYRIWLIVSEYAATFSYKAEVPLEDITSYKNIYRAIENKDMEQMMHCYEEASKVILVHM